MSGRQACLNCGATDLRHGVGNHTDGRVIPLLICRCGQWTRSMLDAESARVMLERRARRGIEVEDLRKVA